MSLLRALLLCLPLAIVFPVTTTDDDDDTVTGSASASTARNGQLHIVQTEPLLPSHLPKIKNITSSVNGGPAASSTAAAVRDGPDGISGIESFVTAAEQNQTENSGPSATQNQEFKSCSSASSGEL